MHPEATEKMRFTWARFAKNGYEVSSQGDNRFSALYARLPDGRTIEEAYQLDVKGYRTITDDWRHGKGRAPLNNLSRDEMWEGYLNLWRAWATSRPDLLLKLSIFADGKPLTDKFATTEVSQARALAQILNEKYGSH